jgi:hypothetical protein
VHAKYQMAKVVKLVNTNRALTTILGRRSVIKAA